MNPLKLMQLKGSWDKFCANHPKFPMFLNAVSQGNVLQLDTIIEINITTADGRTYASNLKITPEDLELIEDVKDIV